MEANRPTFGTTYHSAGIVNISSIGPPHRDLFGERAFPETEAAARQTSRDRRDVSPREDSCLQKTLRIDIDPDPEIAPDFRPAGEPVAQVALEVDLALGLDQEAETVAAAHQRQGRLGGA